MAMRGRGKWPFGSEQDSSLLLAGSDGEFSASASATRPRLGRGNFCPTGRACDCLSAALASAAAALLYIFFFLSRDARW